MAVVKPFRGLRYNPEKIKSLAEVIVPPYDVISPAELEEMKKKNPYNFSHIILSGSGGDHSAAAEEFQSWQDEKVLQKDNKECLYFYKQIFKLDRYELFCQDVSDSVRAGGYLTRTGLFCRVGLEDYSSKIILPHEETFSGPKADRYKLMDATGGNMEPVFLGYDSERFCGDEFEKILLNQAPTVQYTDSYGVAHSLWAVSDSKVHETVEKVLSLQKFYILDGHHRYETALQFYKDHQNSNARLSHRYILADICSFKQPGTVILPTHRLIAGISPIHIEQGLSELNKDFEFQKLNSFDELETLMMNHPRRCFGFKLCDRDEYNFITFKESSDLFRSDKLDLDILYENILPVFSQDLQKLTIGYVKSIPEWEKRLKTSEFQFGFLVRPTTCNEVMQVALNSKKMPHKSTFFYPKIPSGLVINLFD